MAKVQPSGISGPGLNSPFPFVNLTLPCLKKIIKKEQPQHPRASLHQSACITQNYKQMAMPKDGSGYSFSILKLFTYKVNFREEKQFAPWKVLA